VAAATARGVLYVHSSPRALCPHVEWAVGRALGHAVNFAWVAQPVLSGAQRTEFSWQGDEGAGARIASALRGWEHLRYEVTENPGAENDGGRWMHTPDLGVFGSNALELHRELRLALGQAWDDELEPFRYSGEGNPVVWLHKVG
jgi:hypothetical protein